MDNSDDSKTPVDLNKAIDKVEEKVVEEKKRSTDDSFLKNASIETLEEYADFVTTAEEIYFKYLND